MISYLGSLVQFSCPAQGCLCFPVCTAQAPGCSIWSGPCVESSSSFQVLHKSADSVAPALCVFPGLSGSDSQRLGRPLPGHGAHFPSAAPARASGRVSGSLSIGTGGLFAGWEGVASLRLSLPLSPPPCLLPPPGMGWLFSGVSQSLCFANRWRCVRAG